MEEDKIRGLLNEIFGENKSHEAYAKIMPLVEKYRGKPQNEYFSEKDAVLITYGDSLLGEKSALSVLEEFTVKYLKDSFSTIHILPFFPYSSDDGFSVIDYYKVNEELGNWDDIEKIGNSIKLMFDFVLNHVSAKSGLFRNYLAGKEGYENLAISVDPNTDLSKVTRPRTLPLLTAFIKDDGEKVYVWTTFSEDQIDLNFSDVDTFVRMVEVLLFYATKGASMIRLDAIAYLWKEIGTNCIHLPQTHAVVKLFRQILNQTTSSVIITETNVPHKENVSYFGNGYDEAQMVYNFTLPPLLLYTFIKEDSTVFTNWASSLSLPSNETTFFNFTASHDGIGVRPLEGIINESEIESVINHVKEIGGEVSYKTNSDGSKSPYEINITYVDAMSRKDDTNEKHAKRFIASQVIAMSLPGVAAVYIHSLLGSHNWKEGVKITKRARTINREKLNISAVEKELQDPSSLRHIVFNKYTELLKIRRSEKAFHPNAACKVLDVDEKLFACIRGEGEESVCVLVNISSEKQDVSLPSLGIEARYNIISRETISEKTQLPAYEVLWLKKY